MSTQIIERVCVDSRCSYGQHEQVRGHRWTEHEHICDPWPDWSQCNLRHLATEALYRYEGHWAGPATIAALKDFVNSPEAAAMAPVEIIAEFVRRGKEQQL